MLVTRNSRILAEGECAVTIGNFDGVHRGHQAVLKELNSQARARGLRSCVVTFEPHPREFFAPDKAPTRLTSLREKIELLREARVERIHLCRFSFDFARRTAEQFVEEVLLHQLRARWVMIGDDFRFGARRLGDYNLLRKLGGRRGFEVEKMSTFADAGIRVSSTQVREALARGDLATAERLLGRSYTMSGRVVQGERLGRALGFPTANVQIKHNRPPLSGIFVVEVEGIRASALPGVASLGVRPTVTEEGKPVLEVHLLDFAEEIYGSHVRVRFLKKLRDEEKYPDLATLTAQIERDVAQTKHYFSAQ